MSTRCTHTVYFFPSPLPFLSINFPIPAGQLWLYSWITAIPAHQFGSVLGAACTPAVDEDNPYPLPKKKIPRILIDS